MNLNECPEPDKLEHMSLGRLSETEAKAICRHLDDCADCASQMEEYGSGDALTDALRFSTAETVDSEDYQTVIQRAEDLYRNTERLLQQTPPQPVTWVGDRDTKNDALPFSHSFLRPAEKEEELGRLGQYRVLECLGGGGMGIVLRAEHVASGQQVAIKVIRPDRAPDYSSRTRFIREARAVATVKHDHIVTILEVGEDHDVPFIVMELLQGKTLRAHLQTVGSLDENSVLRIAAQVASGLAAAHEAGLIHRDVKPANIWLNDSLDHATILDFGLVKQQDSESVTLTGVVVGTPAYMSPQQVMGKPIDERSDLFSLGVLMFEMLTGHPPFGGQSVTAILVAVSQCEPPELDPEGKLCSIKTRDLISKLISKDPEDRPESAVVVAQELAECQRSIGSQVGFNGIAPKQKAARLAVRKWVWLGTAFAAICALMVVSLTLQTRSGLVLIEIDGEAIELEVGEEGSFQFNDPNDGKPIQITVDHQQQKLSLNKEGFQLATRSFDMSSADGRRISVKFLPRDSNETTSASSVFPKGPPLAKVPFHASKAEQHQLAWADFMGQETEQTIPVTDNQPMVLKLIPAGAFRMGSGPQEQHEVMESNMEHVDYLRELLSYESPPSWATIEVPFWISQHEITVSQFRAFVESTGHQTTAERGEGSWGWVASNRREKREEFTWDTAAKDEPDNRDPVTCVSYSDAMAFCNWMSEQTPGMQFHLPTEVQWEYACRAGASTPFSFGDLNSDIDRYVWHRDNSGRRSRQVGTKEPNAFGLHDMHGNVAEWCRHPFRKSIAETAKWGGDGGVSVQQAEPVITSTSTRRVIRGGYWGAIPAFLRSALRQPQVGEESAQEVGFRVVATVRKKQP